MKITLFAAGSRGDTQPCIALSRGLQHAGYRVRLAAPEDFADFIQQHDVDFAPLRGDVQQIIDQVQQPLDAPLIMPNISSFSA